MRVAGKSAIGSDLSAALSPTLPLDREIVCLLYDSHQKEKMMIESQKYSTSEGFFGYGADPYGGTGSLRRGGWGYRPDPSTVPAEP